LLDVAHLNSTNGLNVLFALAFQELPERHFARGSEAGGYIALIIDGGFLRRGG
jgi:hypothetical protein